MNNKESLEKGIDFLKKTMIFDNMNNDMFWA